MAAHAFWPRRAIVNACLHTMDNCPAGGFRSIPAHAHMINSTLPSWRRPQRPDLRGLSRRRRAARGGAGEKCGRRRRGDHRGVPSGLPQLGRGLHREPAQSEGHPRSRSARHGLKIVERPVANFWPVESAVPSHALRPANRRRAVAAFSEKDAERLPAYDAALDRAASFLRDSL